MSACRHAPVEEESGILERDDVLAAPVFVGVVEEPGGDERALVAMENLPDGEETPIGGGPVATEAKPEVKESVEPEPPLAGLVSSVRRDDRPSLQRVHCLSHEVVQPPSGAERGGAVREVAEVSAEFFDVKFHV